MKELILGVGLIFAALALSPPGEGSPPRPDFEITVPERPTVNIPMPYRQHNWTDNWGNGSCVHASMCMLFRWQGQVDFADRWRRAYSGGENRIGLEAKLRVNKIPFASTQSQTDVGFLEWAIRTRRGCIVVVSGGEHMVVLVDLTETEATILDNNNPEEVIRVPRDQFIQTWSQASSWACTPLYSPPPPLLR